MSAVNGRGAFEGLGGFLIAMGRDSHGSGCSAAAGVSQLRIKGYAALQPTRRRTGRKKKAKGFSHSYATALPIMLQTVLPWRAGLDNGAAFCCNGETVCLSSSSVLAHG